MSKEGYFVYFYYGSNDELLYIGQSIDVGMRWRSHQEEWKKDVVKIGVREYPDHAAMDIFEHYYITKCMSKYNVAGLQHGITEVEVHDPYEMTVYSVDAFERKYVKSVSKDVERNQSKRIIKSFPECLQLYGISIVETEEINLLDEKVLDNNLDEVCFKYENIYFFPSVNKNGISINKSLLFLKEYLRRATISKCEAELRESYTYAAEIDEIVAEEAFLCGCCRYVTTKRTKSGVERKSGWHGRNVFSMLVQENKEFVIYRCSGDFFDECVYIDNYNFRINLKKIYQMEKQN